VMVYVLIRPPNVRSPVLSICGARPGAAFRFSIATIESGRTCSDLGPGLSSIAGLTNELDVTPGRNPRSRRLEADVGPLRR